MISSAPAYYTTSPSSLDSTIWHSIPGHKHHFINRSGDIVSLKRGEPYVLRPFVNKTGCGQIDLDGVRYSVNALLRLVFSAGAGL